MGKQHRAHIKGDAHHQLPRRDQVTIFRLRTGHSRLRHHMFHKYLIGETYVCTCSTAPMTAEHLLHQFTAFFKIINVNV
jgi:hypothetical protein